MSLRNIRRRKTDFGRIVHKIGQSHSNLLLTPQGMKLGLKFKKLRNSFRIEHVSGKHRIVFSKKVHPTHIGEGEHGIVYRLFPKDEKQFLSTSGLQQTKIIPSVVLKIYHPENQALRKPDGFTQFFANSAIYEYLKNNAQGFIVTPLNNLLVSEQLLVREFINAPTVEEARAFMIGNFDKKKPLGEALSNKEIENHLKRYNLNNLNEVDAAEQRMHNIIYEGMKVNFNMPKSLPIEPDPIWKNSFLMGKTNRGTIAFSVIDQGKILLPGIGEMIRKGKISMQEIYRRIQNSK